jgi:DNA-binding transcriptional regulator GbsR (MarR family)
VSQDETTVVPEARKKLDERWRDDAMPFVEKLGFNAERQGHPRTAGRVMGWLLVCEPPWQSVAELALALQSSRSAVNAVVNRMVEFGVFERVAVPGERTTYYRLNSDGGELMFRNMVANLQAMRAIADEGLEALAWRDSEANRRLEDLRAMHLFMEEQMPLMLQRWKQCQEQGEQA